MKKSDLKGLSLAKLHEVEEWVQEAIAECEQEEKAALKAKMEAMAAEAGLTVAEIFGKKVGKRGKVAVKYRHPKDPSLTWTGRGRMPNWLVNEGGDPARFLIK